MVCTAAVKVRHMGTFTFCPLLHVLVFEILHGCMLNVLTEICTRN